MSFRLGIIIPALNEETTIGQVVERTISTVQQLCEFRIIVGDNGSTDQTIEKAVRAGAEVVTALHRGYGSVCLEAVDHLGDWPDYLVFLDADGSSRPEEIPEILVPLLSNQADLVLGNRPDDSPMTLPQRWGTRLAVSLVNRRWKTRYHDMGPFRAIRYKSYQNLGMRDKTWGWTIEMQILSAVHNLDYCEIPVSWEERQAGVSKISGTVNGVLRAGIKILWIVAKYTLKGDKG